MRGVFRDFEGQERGKDAVYHQETQEAEEYEPRAARKGKFAILEDQSVTELRHQTDSQMEQGIFKFLDKIEGRSSKFNSPSAPVSGSMGDPKTFE